MALTPSGCPGWLNAPLTRRWRAFPFGPPGASLCGHKIAVGNSLVQVKKSPRGIPALTVTPGRPGAEGATQALVKPEHWGFPRVLYAHSWTEFRFTSWCSLGPYLAVSGSSRSHTLKAASRRGPFSGPSRSSATLRCKCPSVFSSAPGRLGPPAVPNPDGPGSSAFVRSHWRLLPVVAGKGAQPTLPRSSAVASRAAYFSSAFEACCSSSVGESVLPFSRGAVDPASVPWCPRWLA